MNEAVNQYFFEHKPPVDVVLRELNTLKEKLKPAFPNTILWLFESTLLASLSQLTLVEIVPQKGIRRVLGCTHIPLATFTRGTSTQSGVLQVLDLRAWEHLSAVHPSALLDCAQSLNKHAGSQMNFLVEIREQ